MYVIICLTYGNSNMSDWELIFMLTHKLKIVYDFKKIK